MKNPILPEKAYRLINPGCVVLLTSATGGKLNVMALAWHMPLSINPPLIAVAVAKKHLTAEYIKVSKEFVLNVPVFKILPQVQYCGSVSGRKEDKFTRSGLTAAKAQKVNAPLIEECPEHIECVLQNTFETGDHYTFVGEVVAAAADSDTFNQMWLYTKGKDNFPVHHTGGTLYAVPGLTAEVKKNNKDFWLVASKRNL